jgi:hypothetical protein
MINMKVEISPRLKDSLSALSGPMVQQAAGVALRIEGEIILRESQRQVPVDDGPLKASGRVKGPEMSSGVSRVAVTYGGAASAYAGVQHERTDYAHNPGQKAQYLEDPWLMHAAGPLSKNLSRSMWTFIRGVVR